MSSWVMEIVDSTGTLSFSITPEFFPSLKFDWKRSGEEHRVMDTVPVHGWFSGVGATDEDVKDDVVSKWDRLKAAAANGVPMTFKFKKDSGAVIYTYTNARIESLEAINSAGGYANHLEFRFMIVEERGVYNASLVDFEKRDETTKETVEGGRTKTTFRRFVSATGVKGALSAAKDFVKALKPTTGSITREVLTEDPFNVIATGTWDVDISASSALAPSGFRRWDERASFSPGLRSVTWYRTDAKPIPVRGGRGPARLVVSGRIEVYSIDSLPSATALVGIPGTGGPGGTLPVPYTGFPPSETIVYEDIQVGAPKPIEFDATDVTKPTAYELEYSFAVSFAQPTLTVSRPPVPRHDAFSPPSAPGSSP